MIYLSFGDSNDLSNPVGIRDGHKNPSLIPEHGHNARQKIVADEAKRMQRYALDLGCLRSP